MWIKVTAISVIQEWLSLWGYSLCWISLQQVTCIYKTAPVVGVSCKAVHCVTLPLHTYLWRDLDIIIVSHYLRHCSGSPQIQYIVVMFTCVPFSDGCSGALHVLPLLQEVEGLRRGEAEEEEKKEEEEEATTSKSFRRRASLHEVCSHSLVLDSRLSCCSSCQISASCHCWKPVVVTWLSHGMIHDQVTNNHWPLVPHSSYQVQRSMTQWPCTSAVVWRRGHPTHCGPLEGREGGREEGRKEGPKEQGDQGRVIRKTASEQTIS